jgi:hypothetical protein
MRRLGTVVLILIPAALTAGGCGHAGAEQFGIAFYNDTGHEVVLNLCADDACNNFDYSDKVRAGHYEVENIATENVFTRWAVTESSGRKLGCLPFSFDYAYTDAVVRLSQMVVCPGRRPLPLAGGTLEPH